jgi:hypothetical protein
MKPLDRVLASMAARNADYVPIDRNCTHTLSDETSIYVIYSLEHLRLLGREVREGFTSEQAQAFLLLHGQELKDVIDQTVKDFLKKKVG